MGVVLFRTIFKADSFCVYQDDTHKAYPLIYP